MSEEKMEKIMKKIFLLFKRKNFPTKILMFFLAVFLLMQVGSVIMFFLYKHDLYMGVRFLFWAEKFFASSVGVASVGAATYICLMKIK